jgi:ATP-dependent helicase/nuclease subunit A
MMMSSESEVKPLHHLKSAQLLATEPEESVWLSASAGSGKTQVLTARVIRLLLAGSRPEQILCLTFTKAAAAEMEERINRILAGWVQMKNPLLASDLIAIGADHGPEMQAKARELFAQVLDAPGGGLQIMTIHSFCQSLLGSFPEEAGIAPGFEPIDDRKRRELQREVLSDLVTEAESQSNDWILTKLQQLSLDLGEDGAWNFLNRCAQHANAVGKVPEDDGALVFARYLVGETETGTIDEIMQNQCSDDIIDRNLLLTVADCNRQWNTKTGLDRATKIADWLSSSTEARVSKLEELHSCWATKEGTLVKQGPKNIEAFEALALAALQWCRRLLDRRELLKYADRLASALLVGKAYAARYVAAKHSQGLVDFDDLIEKTAELLRQGRMAEWVRFKLDRRIDHILIDEAQDTNQPQWDIVDALADDFFTGSGQKADRVRTIFAVGDFKQAIYGFQGTDPAKYRDAGIRFGQKLADSGSELKKLTLSQSFRSTQPILTFVNKAIEEIGHQGLGLDEIVPDHESDNPDSGMVELFGLVRSGDDEDEDSDGDEEKWVSAEKRKLAEKLATHIKQLIDEKPYLTSTEKPLEPGNIMVLLRKRSDLAALIVARLHALKVPVAGIDRMLLGEQLAVQDLLSAIRFVLQPGDDMSLACLLVSPLIGWSQQQLLDHGYRAKGEGLWHHLRSQTALENDLRPLRDMLAEADFTSPYAFLETILSGPTQGRRKFAERLGNETLVPIEELLHIALQFAQDGGGTLQDFLDWFERDNGEIKREGLVSAGEVRIMTVHGAKGLQAPVVILADIATDPLKSRGSGSGLSLNLDHGAELPILPFGTALRIGPLGVLHDSHKAEELREHNRLLYVALTRAEERLILTGSVGSKSKTENSWYPVLEAAFNRLGHEWEASSLWGSAMRLEGKLSSVASTDITTEVEVAAAEAPAWLFAPAPLEARPPRPLAPSRIDDADIGDAPAIEKIRIAADRGKLLHGLFERVEGSRAHSFANDAARWLALRDKDGAHDHQELIRQAASVLDNDRWSEIFSPSARAEVPIAALVGETVVTGRIDRLVVTETYVRIVDFKSGRFVPRTAEKVPVSQLRQMAHYVAALEKIFPDRRVEAALLYTFEPYLLTLRDADLEPYKPAS